jgi:UDP-N-acetylglucosamine 2-epimerase (non-hydrolysing)
MIVFGTRPEAIKLIPVIKEIKKHEVFELFICNTSQHTDMLEPILEEFNLIPNFDFNIMTKKQTLASINIKVLKKFTQLLLDNNPDFVIVHGDTTTAFGATLASFYLGIKVLHIEAGLRTRNKLSPFPEEFNRSAISLMAFHHFAPTNVSYKNLIDEGQDKSSITITGNSIVDLLEQSFDIDYKDEILQWTNNEKFIMFTAHRRENAKNFDNMFKALVDILEKYPYVKAVFPVHKSPLVRAKAAAYFKEVNNILLIEPLNVRRFHNLMARSYLIITDSGGIQEEAPTFGIPVVLMRETTERPEALGNGVIVAGTEYAKLFNIIDSLLKGEEFYNTIKPKFNPFGDGNASKRIIEKILELYVNSSV